MGKPYREVMSITLCYGCIVLAVLVGGCKRSTEPTSTAPAPPVPASAVVFAFDDATAGAPAAGFTAGLTGGGGAVRWEVQEAEPGHGKVIAQLSSDSTDTRYPHLVRDDFTAKDVDVSVAFKTLGGEVDAAGGLVFRYQDTGNYYVVRANALEGNVVAYKTIGGKRSNIGVKGKGDAYGVKISVPHKQWNTLRVIAKGRLFEVFLNERKLFDVENDALTAAGKVGIWTKADAVTQFDDLRVKSLD
jgi:hypothetical protein